MRDNATKDPCIILYLNGRFWWNGFSYAINLILEMLGASVTDEDILEFKEQLSQSSEFRRHIRIVGVGQEGVGKTTLCRRLLRQDFSDVEKTRSIERHIYSATITETGETDCKVTVHNMKGMIRPSQEKQF